MGIELAFPIHACTIPVVIYCDVAQRQPRSEIGPAFGESDKAMQRLKPRIGRSQRIGSRRSTITQCFLADVEAGRRHRAEGYEA